MKTCTVRIVLAAALGSIAFACSPTSEAPVSGSTVTNLAEGSTALRARHSEEGEEEEDEAPSIRERSAKGFAISPVPLPTEGLTHKQKIRLGLGSYIVNATAGCNNCHGAGFGFLAGGAPFFLDHAGHVVWSRNLTPDAATGLKLTEAQFLEAIRTGKDFHADQTKFLVVMPWVIFRWMSDEDLKAVYSYLRAVPPVNNVVPPDNKSDLPLPASMPFPGFYNDGVVDRRLPRDQSSFSARRGLAISPLAQPKDLDDQFATYGLGSYIANSMTACNDCHTNPSRTPDFQKITTAAYLTGGTVFGVPPPLQPVLHQVRTMSANLKGATHGFFNEPADSFARFHKEILTQSHADETPPRPFGFPMNLIATTLTNALDEDLLAIYTYVKNVPSVTGPNDGVRQDYARYCVADADCHTGETCSTGTHECVGKACAADTDCDVCQTCSAGACIAPAPASACLASAQ